MFNKNITLLFSERESDLGKQMLFDKIDQFLDQSYLNAPMMLVGSALISFVGYANGASFAYLSRWLIPFVLVITIMHIIDMLCRRRGKYDGKRIQLIVLRSFFGLMTAGFFGCCYLVLPENTLLKLVPLLILIITAIVFVVFISNTLFPEYSISYFFLVTISSTIFFSFNDNLGLQDHGSIMIGLIFLAVFIIIPKSLVMSKISVEAIETRIFLEKEILDHINTKKRIQYQAYHDPLTGVGNRRKFESEVNALIQLGDGEKFAIVYIDLDGFKAVNDTYGHRMGDKVLIEVSLRLMRYHKAKHSELGESMIIRVGGDEFCALYLDVRPEIDWPELLLDIKKVIGQSMTLADTPILLGASVGIGFFPDNGENLDELLTFAERKMYQDKIGRRNRRMSDRT